MSDCAGVNGAGRWLGLFGCDDRYEDSEAFVDDGTVDCTERSRGLVLLLFLGVTAWMRPSMFVAVDAPVRLRRSHRRTEPSSPPLAKSDHVNLTVEKTEADYK